MKLLATIWLEGQNLDHLKHILPLDITIVTDHPELSSVQPSLLACDLPEITPFHCYGFNIIGNVSFLQHEKIAKYIRLSDEIRIPARLRYDDGIFHITDMDV